MSFILLGKDSDGVLALLSDQAYDSQKEAQAALSSITSSPDFAHWESDVLVLDLNKGVPVLLVRPNAPAATKEEPTAAEPEEPAEEPGEPAGEPEELAEEVEEPAEEPEAEPSSESSDLEEPEDAVAIETPAEDEAETEEAAEGAHPLKKALERTAAQMEASGITPPESVGPAGESGEGEAIDSPAGEDQATGEGGGDAAWPWAAGEKAGEEDFSLDALEEPALDEGTLIHAAGDDDTMAASGPVILGSYDEAAPAEPMSELNPEDVPAEASAAADEAAADVSDPESQTAGDAAGAESNEAESDFIMDLPSSPAMAPEPEAVPVEDVLVEPSPDVAVEEAAEEASGGQEVSETPSMTCSDCIYFHTCPNKDGADPASCGSFQWK